jgi:hypothetical protein
MIFVSRGTGGLHLRRRADRLWEVGDEDRHQQTDADALARGQADAERHLFGDPVQKGAEGKGRASIVRARASGAAAAHRMPAGDYSVEQEVGQGTDREPDRGRVEPAHRGSLERELKTAWVEGGTRANRSSALDEKQHSWRLEAVPAWPGYSKPSPSSGSALDEKR